MEIDLKWMESHYFEFIYYYLFDSQPRKAEIADHFTSEIPKATPNYARPFQVLRIKGDLNYEN